MVINQEALESQIPYYLTEPQKEGFTRALKDFQAAQPIDYYISGHTDLALQGDGWPGLALLDFESGEKVAIKGIIISNSCDISVDNPRDIPSKLIFAPLISLLRFREKLAHSNLSEDQIEQKLDAIRKQRVSNIFYLPAGGNLEFEYIALLGDIHTMPLRNFSETPDKTKLFTLSMIGFYLFIFKLSFHFCRFQEEISRA